MAARSRLGHAIAIESVAETAQRDEIARPVGLGFDFLPQIVDLVVHDPIDDMDSVSPNLIQQLLARHQSSRVPDESREQLEFEGGQFHRLAPAAEFALREIKLRVAEAKDLRELRDTASQVRLDPGAQFARAV